MKMGLDKGLIFLLLFVLLLSACSSNQADNRASSSVQERNNSSAPSGGNSGSDLRSSEPVPPMTPEKGKQRGGVGGQNGPEPQAGQLTAGEWNDTLNWERFTGLLNGRLGSDYQEQWGYFPVNRLAIEVYSGGKPYADAQLLVKDKSGRTVWEARTDLYGRAFAYASLFGDPNQSGGGTYSVEVAIGNNNVKRYENVSLPRQEVLRIEITERVKLSDAADVMFVVDTTGSMSDELQYLAAELKDVIRTVDERSGQQLKLRLSANFYRDKYDEYVLRPFPFSSSVEDTVAQIAAQKAEGGGDYPEAVDEALFNALHEHEWSEQARARLLFLVLDAPPHSDKRTLARMRDLTADAARLGVRIIPVVSSGIDEATEYLMRFLAVSTGGTYVFLTDHSGIGNEHHEPDVGEYEVRLLNELLAELIIRYTVSEDAL